MNNNLSIVFPGQGSQTVGMLKELAATYPQIQKTFTEASQVLDIDLWDLSQLGPEEKLNRTEYAQPALLIASVSVWRLWREQGGAFPAVMAGHSLGEYSALVCADAIDFQDAVKLVHDRGRFMQEAYTGESAMVAIVGLQQDEVERICEQASQGEVLVAANYNSIGQIVLSGQFNAAKRAAELAKTAGAKIAKILPVSVPSHCILMKPAAERLAKRLEQITINSPRIPVINNVDVACYDKPSKICDALVRQLYNPVRWVETVQFMVANGIKSILECGPGKVLSGLNKRVDGGLMADYIGAPDKIVNYAKQNF